MTVTPTSKEPSNTTLPSRSRPGVLGLIGNTPLVKLQVIDTGPCELFVKLESHNPGGSIKDRIGLSMIEAAEAAGHIDSSTLIVEATAGNTGLGLALVAALKRYRLLLVIPDKMSQEKVTHLKALGAEVVMTRSDVGKGHPQYYQDLAAEIARKEGGHFVNQFENPANPLAHETTTAPEIWAQTNGRLDAVVCGVGSGGTITGIGNFLRRTAPHVDLVLADPAGSVLAGWVKERVLTDAGSWLVEGIGEDFLPPICNLDPVKQAYTIDDEESLLTARTLLREEGILAGSSSGTLLAAAIRYCRAQTQPKRVVTFVCDSGSKYLSKMFDDGWMHDQGFLRGVQHGDLRDIIGRSAETAAVVTVSPSDALIVAFSRMKLYGISQLPVLDGARVVGILDESDVLLAAIKDSQAFRRPVQEFMSTALIAVQPKTEVEELLPLFDRGLVPIVRDIEGKFLGLVTRSDVLSFLRRKFQ